MHVHLYCKKGVDSGKLRSLDCDASKMIWSRGSSLLCEPPARIIFGLSHVMNMYACVKKSVFLPHFLGKRHTISTKFYFVNIPKSFSINIHINFHSDKICTVQ